MSTTEVIDLAGLVVAIAVPVSAGAWHLFAPRQAVITAVLAAGQSYLAAHGARVDREAQQGNARADLRRVEDEVRSLKNHRLSSAVKELRGAMNPGGGGDAAVREALARVRRCRWPALFRRR